MRHVPNALTFGRLFLGLCVGLLAIWPGGGFWALASFCFALAALSDLLDGYLARRFAVESRLGRVFDPLADKVLVTVALVSLTAGGIVTSVHGFAVIVILVREILVTGLRDMMAEKGPGLPVMPLARWKTALQMLSGGALLASAAWPMVGVRAAGLVLLWIAAGLTLWTGVLYGFQVRHHLRQQEKRALP